MIHGIAFLGRFANITEWLLVGGFSYDICIILCGFEFILLSPILLFIDNLSKSLSHIAHVALIEDAICLIVFGGAWFFINYGISWIHIFKENRSKKQSIIKTTSDTWKNKFCPLIQYEDEKHIND